MEHTVQMTLPTLTKGKVEGKGLGFKAMCMRDFQSKELDGT